MTAHGGAAGSILAVRLDGMGDMLLAGPAIRALAAAGRGVTVRAGQAYGAEPDGDSVDNSSASGGLRAGVTRPPS